jgi:nucleoside-specific outer membrane channel protein Tsx
MRALYIMLLFCIYAEAFSTTNIQLLYGDFDDNSYLFDTKNGGKTTVTVEHFRTWEYGDLFLFADYCVADDRFKYQDKKADLYGEVAPRISLSKITDSKLSFLFVEEIYLAFQFNAGDDYEAYLGGLGADLNIVGFDVFGANIYYKDQSIGGKTLQFSLNYLISNIMKTSFEFNGFADWTEDDFLTQNQLLYNMDKTFGMKEDKFYIGTEWHYYNLKNSDVVSNTFQVMMKYCW